MWLLLLLQSLLSLSNPRRKLLLCNLFLLYGIFFIIKRPWQTGNLVSALPCKVSLAPFAIFPPSSKAQFFSWRTVCSLMVSSYLLFHFFFFLEGLLGASISPNQQLLNSSKKHRKICKRWSSLSTLVFSYHKCCGCKQNPAWRHIFVLLKKSEALEKG